MAEKRDTTHDDSHEGWRHDQMVMRRRGFLGAASAVGLVGVLASCGQSSETDSSATGTTGDAAIGAPPEGAPSGGPGGGPGGPPPGGEGAPGGGMPGNDSLVDGEIPNETAGPYPGDGSNGENVLDDNGVVRKDIRSSIGGGDTQDGVPLTLRLTVRDLTTSDAMAGAAVYAWHCNADGEYSMYSDGVEDQTFLRGVQECDSSGTAEFTTIFPGCYAGRWPHVHFEVYSSVTDAEAQDGDNPIVKVSQVAFPAEACEAVYEDTGTYPSSTRNLSQLSLASDNVFGDDGGVLQIATMTGDAASGYEAQLAVGVVAS